MQLTNFRSLIESMPTPQQAFEAKRETWQSQIDNGGPASEILGTLFGNDDSVFTSRSDLRQIAATGRLPEFVVATILWGYPQGMRGTNFADMMNSLHDISALLLAPRTTGIAGWMQHYAAVEEIKGLGLSTYTKFLCFLDTQVAGMRALILDDRIIRIARRGVFIELQPIANLRGHNAAANYPAYLECMHTVAAGLRVPAENLEFFLFEFGLNLK